MLVDPAPRVSLTDLRAMTQSRCAHAYCIALCYRLALSSRRDVAHRLERALNSPYGNSFAPRNEAHLWNFTMTLDLDGLPDSELKRLITGYCAAFGGVRMVEIRRMIGAADCNLAVVEMTYRSEAMRAAEELGERDIGSTIVITLKQQAKVIPACLMRR